MDTANFEAATTMAAADGAILRTGATQALPQAPHVAQVQWFRPDFGYGFLRAYVIPPGSSVTRETGVFAHITKTEGPDGEPEKALYAGEWVAFDPEWEEAEDDGSRRCRATKIRKLVPAVFA